MVDIPDSVFKIYRDFADDFITSNFGVRCTLIYPSKTTKCANCVYDNIGKKSANKYKHGGPRPFRFGNCPACAGNGEFEIEQTEDITMRVYYESKSFIKVANSTGTVADADAQVIGFMHDLPKFERANEIHLDVDQGGYKTFRFTRMGEALPHGFKHNRYFLAHLSRV